MLKTVVFVGAGKLATNLAVAMQKQGFEIMMVYSRTEPSARALAGRIHSLYTLSLAGLPPNADIYIYALKDDVLASVIAQVRSDAQSLHLHTAGSMSLDVFGPDKSRCGVIYPFQTFNKEHLVSFSKIPILVESRIALKDTFEVAQKLSNMVFECSSQARKRLHLAGVMANNFVMCMYALAAEQLEKEYLPFDVLLPLIDQTADRVHIMAPNKAFTGPAIRGDQIVQNEHVAMLDSAALKDLYRLISSQIQRLGGNIN